MVQYGGQGRALVNTAMNLWALEKAENFLISRAIFSLSKPDLLLELIALNVKLHFELL